MGHGGRVRVVVADDHPIYREGVVRALEESECLEVVAQASDGASALSKLRALRPHVALLDVRMPALGGLEVLEALVAGRSPTRVILLSRRPSARRARESRRHGLKGGRGPTPAMGALRP